MIEIITSIAAGAGGWLTAALAAIAAFVSAIFYHRHKVSKAENQGRDDGAAIERDRIRTESEAQERKIKDRKHEIKDKIDRDTADRDSLRDRMRDGASDRADP